ncbi:MAG: tetraacyldisaccharide 4'-kinase [Deltaproteobacteria bacterium]|nr:tetraacyldisaccharide 4'-kinase [Deltaproteobacteria bacterium]
MTTSVLKATLTQRQSECRNKRGLELTLKIFSPLYPGIPTLIYRSLMAGRNLLYDLLPALSQAVDIPVICVGNLSTGGTGKTPMTAYLADYFQAQGLNIAILSRGYGRKAARRPQLVNAATKITPELAAELGDEALMLRQQLPSIPLVLDGNRVRGARRAGKELSPDLILLDDGFQHRRLRRNFNLLMIDSQKLFGNRRLLPAGPLRETLQALRRADAIVFNKFDQRQQHFYKEAAEVCNYISARRIFSAAYHFTHFTAGDGRRRSLLEMQELGPFCACSGLANNDYFFVQLRAHGLLVEETRSFADHHDYRAGDLRELIKLCRDRPLLTTAKDAVKLSRLARTQKAKIQLWVAEIALIPDREKDFLDLFAAFVGPEAPLPKAKP